VTNVRKILVIGCGNSFRQDDGLGCSIAEQLTPTEFNNCVRVLVCQQLTPDLAVEMSNTDRVILIDATVDGTPGRVSVQKIEPTDQGKSILTHELQASTLLQCARVLYASNPDTYLVSVTGVSFGFGKDFSDAVQAAMPEVTRRIKHLITESHCSTEELVKMKSSSNP
jgi:hydrogenase maturation protease